MSKTTPAGWLKPWLSLLLLAALLLLPFISQSLFNSKGEPREALVAQQMLETGNWILPENEGGEFAYKPPMFHWCIAALSSIRGEVTEGTARMPSALAAIGLALLTLTFFSRRQTVKIAGRGDPVAFLAAVLLLTTFEVNRAATNCRVDMLLTFFIVAAIMRLTLWVERGSRGLPWLAILCMGCGVLTKGPVAILLPCLVGGVLSLRVSNAYINPIETRSQRLRRWLRIFLKYTLFALLSLLLPAIWYYFAWRQVGDKFLYLVYEENVLRFLGRMPYHSHEHTALYYLPILLSGLLPWSLLLLAYCGKLRSLRNLFRRPWLREKVSNLHRICRERITLRELAAVLAIVLILAFYLIPKSKRGVYILPVYPFLSYYLAKLLYRMTRERPRFLKWMQWVFAGVMCVGILAIIIVSMGWINAPLFTEGLEAIGTERTWVLFSLVLLCIYFLLLRHLPSLTMLLYSVTSVFIFLQAFVLPPVLNEKSDFRTALLVREATRGEDVYSYVWDATGMTHHFTIDFYLGGRMKDLPCLNESERFNTSLTAMSPSGWLLIGEKDLARFSSTYPQCQLEPEYVLLNHRSCDTRQYLHLYHYTLKAQ